MVETPVNNLRKLCLFCFMVITLVTYGISIVQAQTSQDVTPKKTTPAKAKKVAKNVKKSSRVTAVNHKSYKVKKGETIAKIARVNRISVASVLAINPGVNPKKIRPGSTIKLPASSHATKRNRDDEFKKVPQGTQLVYRVKKGETLYSISKKFNLTHDEIKNLNKLRDDTIVAGMPLLIRALDSSKHANGEESGYALQNPESNDDAEGDEDIAQEDGVETAKELQLKYTLNNDDVRRLMNYALDFLGTTYKYGGSNVAAIDCSAFVKTVFKEVNIPLPRTSREQILLGIDVPRENLREGDLLFFAKRKRINHVAMYIGNDMYIHAARKGKGVIVSKIDSPYFKKTFVGAKRMFQLEPDKATESNPSQKDLSSAGEKELVN